MEINQLQATPHASPISHSKQVLKLEIDQILDLNLGLQKNIQKQQTQDGIRQSAQQGALAHQESQKHYSQLQISQENKPYKNQYFFAKKIEVINSRQINQKNAEVILYLYFVLYAILETIIYRKELPNIIFTSLLIVTGIIFLIIKIKFKTQREKLVINIFSLLLFLAINIKYVLITTPTDRSSFSFWPILSVYVFCQDRTLTTQLAAQVLVYFMICFCQTYSPGANASEPLHLFNLIVSYVAPLLLTCNRAYQTRLELYSSQQETRDPQRSSPEAQKKSPAQYASNLCNPKDDLQNGEIASVPILKQHRNYSTTPPKEGGQYMNLIGVSGDAQAQTPQINLDASSPDLFPLRKPIRSGEQFEDIFNQMPLGLALINVGAPCAQQLQHQASRESQESGFLLSRSCQPSEISFDTMNRQFRSIFIDLGGLSNREILQKLEGFDFTMLKTYARSFGVANKGSQAKQKSSGAIQKQRLDSVNLNLSQDRLSSTLKKSRRRKTNDELQLLKDTDPPKTLSQIEELQREQVPETDLQKTPQYRTDLFPQNAEDQAATSPLDRKKLQTYKLSEIVQQIRRQNFRGFRDGQTDSYEAITSVTPSHEHPGSANPRSGREKKPPKQPITIKLRISIVSNNKLLIILEDITELEKIQLMKSNQQFANTIFKSFSHELRTPFNGSLGYLQAASINNTIPENVIRDHIHPAMNSLQLGLYMINDFLDLQILHQEKKLNLTHEQFQIQQVTHELQNLFDYQMKKKEINFQILSSNDVPESYNSDFNKFCQILVSLVNNSIRYTKRGGLIRVKFSIYQRYVLQIEVEDSGSGIAPKELEDLRKKLAYEQLDHTMLANSQNSQKQFGLGLIIAQQLLRQLAPKRLENFQITSELSKGTTFKFFLSNMSKARLHQAPDNIFLEIPEQSPMDRTQEKLGFSDVNSATRGPARSVFFQSRQPGNDSQERVPRHKSKSGMRRSHSQISLDVPTKIQDLEKFSKNFSPNKTKQGSGCDGSASLYSAPASECPEHQKENQMRSRNFDFNDHYVQKMKFRAVECHCQRVLIVEDEYFNVDSLQHLLRSLNYRYEYAENGAECLELVRRMYADKSNHCSSKSCRLFTAILMDCNMPIMNGQQASRQLQEIFAKELPWIPIIACTAYVNEQQSCYDSGMDDYLVKPLKLQLLRTRLQAWSKKFTKPRRAQFISEFRVLE